jgi:hypothetical protein
LLEVKVPLDFLGTVGFSLRRNVSSSIDAVEVLLSAFVEKVSCFCPHIVDLAEV